MTDAPETVWIGPDRLLQGGAPNWQDGDWGLTDEELKWPEDATEYRRADLPRSEDAARIAELEARLAEAREVICWLRQDPRVCNGCSDPEDWAEEAAWDTTAPDHLAATLEAADAALAAMEKKDA